MHLKQSLFASVDARTSCTDGCGTALCRCPSHDPSRAWTAAGAGSQTRSRTGMNPIRPAGAGPFEDRKRVSRKRTRRRRLLPAAEESQQKGKESAQRAHVCAPIPFHGRRAAMIDAAHASRHTWRAVGARKASITRKDLSGGALPGNL